MSRSGRPVSYFVAVGGRRFRRELSLNGRGSLRFERDEVVHTDNTRKRTNRALGSIAFVIPRDLPSQGDQALLYFRGNGLKGAHGPMKRALGGGRDVGIIALFAWRERDTFVHAEQTRGGVALGCVDRGFPLR